MNKKNIKVNTELENDGNLIDATNCNTNKEFVATIEKSIKHRTNNKKNIQKAVADTCCAYDDSVLVFKESNKEVGVVDVKLVRQPWYKKLLKQLRRVFITTEA